MHLQHWVALDLPALRKGTSTRRILQEMLGARPGSGAHHFHPGSTGPSQSHGPAWMLRNQKMSVWSARQRTAQILVNTGNLFPDIMSTLMCVNIKKNLIGKIERHVNTHISITSIVQLTFCYICFIYLSIFSSFHLLSLLIWGGISKKWWLSP